MYLHVSAIVLCSFPFDVKIFCKLSPRKTHTAEVWCLLKYSTSYKACYDGILCWKMGYLWIKQFHNNIPFLPSSAMVKKGIMLRISIPQLLLGIGCKEAVLLLLQKYYGLLLFLYIACLGKLIASFIADACMGSMAMEIWNRPYHVPVSKCLSQLRMVGILSSLGCVILQLWQPV